MSGKPAARVGDPVANGVIVAGSNSVFIGGSADGQADCPCKDTPTAGNPINPMLGIKVVKPEVDFALPAPATFAFSRRYASDDTRVGPLGQGWAIGLCSITLDVTDTAVIVTDAQGRHITFGPLSPGQTRESSSEGFWLRRGGDEKPWQGRWAFLPETVQRSEHRIALLSDDTALVFAPEKTDATRWHLKKAVDHNGYLTAFGWTPLGLPHVVKDSAGRVYCFVYSSDAPIRLLGVALAPTDEEGHSHSFDPLAENVEWLVRYYYDADHNLAQVANAAGEIVRRFAYREHILTQHSYLDGRETRYEYDHYAPTGRVVLQAEKEGLTRRYVYHSGHTDVADSIGRSERYEFEGEGGMKRWTAHVQADGSVKRFAYDSEGRLFKSVDELGRETYYRKDGITTPDGMVFSARLDEKNGLPVETGTPNGQTEFAYDTRGNAVRVVAPDKSITLYFYESPTLPDRPTRIVDAQGGVKHLTWTELGQLECFTDCSGSTTTFHYDKRGRRISETNALGQSTYFQYDNAGRLIKVRHPDGQEVEQVFDSQGRLERINGPDGELLRNLFDSVGRVVQVLDASGNPLGYEYDMAGRLAALTNENGACARFTWDVRNRLMQETGFDERVQRYTYNAASELVARVENGRTVRYERDLAGRLTSLSLPPTEHTPASIHRFRYDNGRLVEASSPEARIEIGYDKAGRRVAETQAHADDWHYQTAHRYTPLGSLECSRHAYAPEIQWLTYGSGHLHGVLVDGSPVLAFERDALHREIARHAGGLVRHTAWDVMGRLMQHVLGLAPEAPIVEESSTSGIPQPEMAIWARDYHYDSVGLLRGVDDSVYGALAYDYDKAGRLIGSRHGEKQRAYRFDPAGNRLGALEKYRPEEVNPLAPYDARQQVPDNRLSVFEGTSLHYDASGNLVEKRRSDGTQFTFNYDALHRMVSLARTNPDGSTLKASYVYDVFGRRIRKSVEENGQTRTTRYGWDADRLCAEIRDGHALTTYYLPDSFVPLLRVEQAVETDPPETVELRHMLAQRGHVLPPVKATTPTLICHYHTDHLGTPLVLTENSGNALWVAEPDDWAAACGERKRTEQPIRFQGQYHDEESGLYYNRYRYYDPQMARYVTQDPVGLRGGANLFAYVGGNPQTYTDPMGLCKCKGVARVFQGNKNLVGKGGGFNTNPSNLENYAVTADSAAVAPIQFGLSKSQMRPIVNQISGVLDNGVKFNAVRDVMDDYSSRKALGMNTAQFEQHLVDRETPGNGGKAPLLLELPGADKDYGYQGVTLEMPDGYPCPQGTTLVK